jgi:hypothetical protein
MDVLPTKDRIFRELNELSYLNEVTLVDFIFSLLDAGGAIGPFQALSLDPPAISL